MSARMHEDQVDVDEGLVRRLLAEQMPGWAGLPLTPVAEQGTDHALFRLGTGLVVRMPVIGWADGQAALEAEWLPRLAPHLPLEVSVPQALGGPGLGYPFRWSVHPWLTGDRLDPASVVAVELARDLAGFVRALRSCDTTGAGRFGSRGGPLSEPTRDRDTRASLDSVRDLVDADAALSVWEAGRAAAAWSGSPTWFHGDLTAGNLLVRDGRLSGVLDWGPCGVGDPRSSCTRRTSSSNRTHGQCSAASSGTTTRRGSGRGHGRSPSPRWRSRTTDTLGPSSWPGASGRSSRYWRNSRSLGSNVRRLRRRSPFAIRRAW